MNSLTNFNNSLTSLIIDNILRPLAEHFRKEGVEITLQDLFEMLSISDSVGCAFTPDKGPNKNIRCGKLVEEGKEYCKTHSKKSRVSEPSKQKESYILNSLPRQLLGKPGKEVTPISIQKFVGKPLVLKGEKEETEEKEESEEETDDVTPTKSLQDFTSFGSLKAKIPTLTLGTGNKSS